MPGEASRNNGRKGGRPKGALSTSTITRNALAEVMREEIATLVRPRVQSMVEAQAAHAEGVSYMVLRNPDGTFTRATDEKQIDAACAIGASAFRIFTQAPNPQAFVALLDRTIGKPSEHVELTGKDGEPLVVKWQSE
jgi:hypothetical protein